MLGPAHLFVPFSAADLHWDDLMRHLPRYEDWKTAYTTERMRIASINLRDNPHIAAQWFYIRFDVFRDMVLRPRFAIVNYWDRFEWQGRGSSHNHALYWMDHLQAAQST